MAQNKIDALFQRLKKQKSKAFIGYLTAGFPSFPEWEKCALALERGGLDLLEIGIPFSDPVADGPTIQVSSQLALEKGVSLPQIFQATRKLSQKTDMPLVFMTYLNPILRYGPEKFAKAARQAGVSGVIAPDLIPEEAQSLRAVFKNQGIYLINLIAPTTPPQRQLSIARQSRGFLYAVSVSGVTGARKKYSPETLKWLKKIGQNSKVPVCVGFGISGPEQVRQIKKNVQGVIVGSALIDLIRRNSGPKRTPELVKFAKKISKELKNGR